MLQKRKIFNPIKKYNIISKHTSRKDDLEKTYKVRTNIYYLNNIITREKKMANITGFFYHLLNKKKLSIYSKIILDCNFFFLLLLQFCR